jgi:hypothetical protein
MRRFALPGCLSWRRICFPGPSSPIMCLCGSIVHFFRKGMCPCPHTFCHRTRTPAHKIGARLPKGAPGVRVASHFHAVYCCRGESFGLESLRTKPCIRPGGAVISEMNGTEVLSRDRLTSVHFGNRSPGRTRLPSGGHHRRFRRRATSNQQPVTSNKQPVTSNKQPATSNQ